MREDNIGEPELDAPLSLSVTPSGLINALFATAGSVHTGWESCVDKSTTLVDLRAVGATSGNYCRYVEQEFSEPDAEGAETTWHDWTVEVVLGGVVVTGHWSVAANGPPMDWEWSAREAEKAFDKACVLFGKRVTHTFQVVDDPGSRPAGNMGVTH